MGQIVETGAVCAILGGMPKRSRKPSPDPIRAAFDTLQHIIEKTERQQKAEAAKNPAAVALGRLGGLKGGHARAKVLSGKRRREIALKAAQARWARNRAIIDPNKDPSR
jgi:hypothetical protein